MALNKTGKLYEGLPENLPNHIGFIMDGNGRWAKKRLMPRTMGHIEGAKVFKNIVRHCRNIGIKYISFYAFSTENWKRPPEEVMAIMKLFQDYLLDTQELFDEQIRLIFIGDKEGVNESLREQMIKIENDTKNHKNMTLYIAINYGGRDEIKHAAAQIAEKVKDGLINPEDITEDMISQHIYTSDCPDVDFMIRPSGELRLSNFMIWQSAYAEFYFTDVLWPDFTPEELNKALIEYSKRGRRFGGV